MQASTGFPNACAASAITDAILDGWFGVGKNARNFEDKFSEYLKVDDTIVTNSGASANLIALVALMSHQFKHRLEKEDEVTTPALTFPTTFNPIIQNGLKPVVMMWIWVLIISK